MDKFIEKMEALLRLNSKCFIIILSVLTILGLLMYVCISFLWGILENTYHDLLKVYMESASGLLIVAGILWIILFGTQQESNELNKLDKFLEERGNKKDTFFRKDLAEFFYEKDLKSSTSEYKALGKLLRDAVEMGKIQEINP